MTRRQAEPIPWVTRAMHYQAQGKRRALTPRQARRLRHKARRAMAREATGHAG
jgi:hypothetical protein